MSDSSSLLKRLGYFIILATTFLFPVFFLPFTSEFYDFNKQALLIVSTALLLIIWTITFLIDKQVRITRNPFGLPLILFTGVLIASTFLRTPNYTDALLEPTQTGTLIALILFFTTSINFIHSKKEIESIAYSLITSTTILAILGILWGSGLLSKIIPFNFMKTPVWNPVGSGFPLLITLAVVAPFLLVQILREKGNSLKTLIFSVILFLSIVACGLQGYRLFSPNSAYKPLFLSQNTSWSIAMESLKISPFIGTGPSTYLSDFTRFRPIDYNMTSNWAIRFSNGSNYYLEILATLGILGLISYLFLVFRVFSTLTHFVKSKSESPLHSLALGAILSVAVVFISQVFLPVNQTVMFIAVVMLILVVASLKQIGSSLVHEANIDIVAASDSGIRTPILPWISFLLALGLVGPSLFFYTRSYIAETYFRNALTAASANQGRDTYQSLISAISWNPFRDVYRVAYSQTNMLLASSVASQPNPTPETRDTIVQLIQQAIREGKNAISLNPTKVSNTENLADIYRNLMGSVDGADSWALAAYRQAVSLDPANPNLRIALGGVLYSLKNYDEAVTVFQQAVNLKPNYPNAHYNLAIAFRDKGDLQNAFQAMQNVVSTIDRNSPDYSKATSELEDLRKKLGQAAPVPTPSATKAELQAPRPLPSPKIKPPVELPAELGPESTPTPTPRP